MLEREREPSQKWIYHKYQFQFQANPFSGYAGFIIQADLRCLMAVAGTKGVAYAQLFGSCQFGKTNRNGPNFKYLQNQKS